MLRAERIRTLPALEERISLICGCKGTTIQKTGKEIMQLFSTLTRFLQLYTLYIIYAREERDKPRGETRGTTAGKTRGTRAGKEELKEGWETLHGVSIALS